MSLASEYWKLEGFETLEIPDIGFATYVIKVPECYIRDIYVRPEFRKLGTATKIADLVSRIAKEQGCKTLIGSVNPNYEHARESHQVLTSYGFRHHTSTTQLEIYVKEL